MIHQFSFVGVLYQIFRVTSSHKKRIEETTPRYIGAKKNQFIGEKKNPIDMKTFA